MKPVHLIICLLFLSANIALAEGIVRWVDKDGKVHYGNKPEENAVVVEQKKFGSAPGMSDDELPYNVRKAKQDFPVVFYVTASCGEPCNQARAFLNKRGIPFAEKLLATKEEFDAYKAKTGGSGVPAITVGKTLLLGFEAGQWNSELDIVGYPKVAPYGTRPIPPAVIKPKAPAETDTEK